MLDGSSNLPTSTKSKARIRVVVVNQGLTTVFDGGDLVIDSVRKPMPTIREAFAVSEAKPRTANDSSYMIQANA